MHVLGLEFAPLSIPLERRLQTFAVLIHVILFYFLGFASLAFMIVLLFSRYYYLPLLYLVWYLYDKDKHNRGGRLCRCVRRWRIWKHYADYYPLKLIKTADLDPGKNYIIGYHPHGIMSVGAWGNFCTEATGFSKLFPGITCHMLTLVMNFLFPIQRECVLSMGMCPASKEGMEWLLTREGKGKALVLVIGGAAEALDAHPEANIRLTLKRRKGFLRLALKHGASLVPSFGFGENELYSQFSNPQGSLLRKIQEKVKNILGVSTPLICGRGIFQYSIGLIPYRKPLTTVIGRPIDVKQMEEPTDEDIMQLQDEYIQALQELYDEYKGEYASNPNLQLEL